MYKLGIVCVDFNGWGLTAKFCASLQRQLGRGAGFLVDCVVVDNSTNAEMSQSLRDSLASFDFVSILTPGGNLGYFGGINFGLSCLAIDNFDYVIICNNDLEFADDFCSVLIAKAYPKDVFAVCPSVVTDDGYQQNPHVLKPIGFWRRMKYDIYYSNFYVARVLSWILSVVRPTRPCLPRPEGACEIHMGIGAIYVLTRHFFSTNRTLHYPYFLYGEEAFLSNQIHSSGGVLWFDSDLRVEHAESGSTSRIPRRAVYEFSRKGYPEYRKML